MVWQCGLGGHGELTSCSDVRRRASPSRQEATAHLLTLYSGNPASLGSGAEGGRNGHFRGEPEDMIDVHPATDR